MSPDKPVRTASLTVICVLLVSVAAGAFEFPPVGGIDAPGGDEKRFTLDVGAYLGTDSNIRRSAEAIEDNVVELLGGVGLWAGNERRKFDLRAQVRADRYSKESQYDFDETTVLAGAQFGGKESAVRAGFRGKYASLGDPNDIELPEIIRRTSVSASPTVDIRSGKLEFGLGYSLNTTEYEHPIYGDRYDHDDASLGAEIRWGRSDRQQLFAHFDTGGVDYRVDDYRDDFDYNRIYFGWRAEGARMALELAAGPSNVETPSLSEGELFTVARANLVGERRSVLLAVARAPEAAARAQYKIATRFVARYLQNINTRLSWSVGVTSEKADLVEPDPDGAPSSVDRFVVQGGFAWELGSPGRTHGRLYVNVNQETGSGDSTSYADYERTRLLVGVAMVR